MSATDARANASALRHGPGSEALDLPDAGDVIGVAGRRYRLVREIGRGAAGVVFEVVPVDGPPTRLAAKLPRTARAAERLAAEASAAARVGHPRIARVIDRCLDAAPPFIVLELAARGDLRRELVAAGGPLAPERAMTLFRSVATAVAFAHERGVVHGDIKPENVLIADDGHPKVGDFGSTLVREERARALANSLAGLGDDPVDRVRGTFGYLAPELWDGGEPTVRSDVFSLGVLLYECLTGRRPVGSFAPASQLAPGAPAFADRLLERALAADPDDRPADAAALLAELDAARHRASGRAPRSSDADLALDAPVPGGADAIAAARRIEEVRLDAELHALVHPQIAEARRARRRWTAVALIAWVLLLSFAAGGLTASAAAGAQTLEVLCVIGLIGLLLTAPLALWLARAVPGKRLGPLERARRGLPPAIGPVALPTGEPRPLDERFRLLPIRLRRLVVAEARLGLRDPHGWTRRPLPRRRDRHAAADDAAGDRGASFRPGAIVGPWRLVALLGTGAHGEVWRARPDDVAEPGHDDSPPIEVALKLPLDEDAVVALGREVDSARRLDAVTGFRRVIDEALEDRPPWVAMELIEGRDLAHCLDEAGALPPADATRLVLSLARALADAHRAGIVHGDLSPRNVIIDHQGEPVVTDLGASRALDGRRLQLSFSLSMSLDGSAGFGVLGTLSCAAPEVLEGRCPDRRSDVFSLGAVAYAAFTGRRPVGRLGTLGEDLPLALAHVVRRCLDPDPERRYPSAVEAQAAIRGALELIDLRIARALGALDAEAREAYYRLAMQVARARARRVPPGPQRRRLLRMLSHAKRQRAAARGERRRVEREREARRAGPALEPTPRSEEGAVSARRAILSDILNARLQTRAEVMTLGLDVAAMPAAMGRGEDELVSRAAVSDPEPSVAAEPEPPASPAPARAARPGLGGMLAGALGTQIERESGRLGKLGRDAAASPELPVADADADAPATPAPARSLLARLIVGER